MLFRSQELSCRPKHHGHGFSELALNRFATLRFLQRFQQAAIGPNDGAFLSQPGLAGRVEAGKALSVTRRRIAVPGMPRGDRQDEGNGDHRQEGQAAEKAVAMGAP